MPFVTVIIPAFNAQPTLAETIRSLLAQTLADWRAVIVDDGSTDATPGIAADFAWRDPRIQVVRQPNRGLAAARNTGLAHARGDYIHFLDADDWLEPSALERLTQTAEWSGLGAACGSWTVRDAQGRPLGVRMPPPDAIVGREHLLAGNRLAPHSHILRRDLLATDRFDESLRVVEDYDLWLRLASRGVRWAGADDTVASYRVRPGSLSKDPRAMLRTTLDVLARHAGERPDAARALALFYASARALADPDPQPALGLLGEHVARTTIWRADELGDASWWALLFAHAIGPAGLVEHAPIVRARLLHWWNALGARHAQDEALHALARRSVQPEPIARALLDALPAGARCVDLLGAMGANGRVLSAAARARGVAVRPRDDRLPGARIDGPYDPDAVAIIAPGDDAAILSRVPPGVRALRWSVERDIRARRVTEALGVTRPQAARSAG